MMETLHDVTRMRLVAGNLALDFVNSRSGPREGEPDDDLLTGYAELVAWARHAGSLTAAEESTLLSLSADDPSATEVAFDRSLRIRDDLDQIFRALASGAGADPSSLARLRDAESDALRNARLVGDDTFAWSWQDDRTLARPLRPVVHAAVRLLTGAELSRVKRCGGCRFLFVDESKNHSRRWCSMDDCGTAEKMRRYVAARRSRTSG